MRADSAGCGEGGGYLGYVTVSILYIGICSLESINLKEYKVMEDSFVHPFSMLWLLDLEDCLQVTLTF